MHKATRLGRLALCSVLLLNCWYDGETEESGDPDAPQRATSLAADCLCDQGSDYLNAYTYQAPLRPQAYRSGAVITVTAGVCRYPSACDEQALVGSYKMRVAGTTTDTRLVYDFSIYGPRVD